MRMSFGTCFIHLLIYKKLLQEHAQKWLLGFMFFFVISLPACPVCFCNELGWPDHITVTYNVNSSEKKAKNSYSVEILCAPLKEVSCGIWHDDTQDANQDANTEIKETVLNTNNTNNTLANTTQDTTQQDTQNSKQDSARDTQEPTSNTEAIISLGESTNS